ELEVRTLFHEFGHALHDVLSTAPFHSLSSLSVARDFVEAPSQMFENWVYQTEVLALISEDPEHPGHPMPESLAKRLVAARTFNAGVDDTRQVWMALIDLRLHTEPEVRDFDALEHEASVEVIGYPPARDMHWLSTFAHTMGGYDAGYYGYLWSLVYA